MGSEIHVSRKESCDGPISEVNFRFGRKLKRLLKEYYCIDVKVVFSSFKVKNYFFLKCHTPMPLMANVVYQFTCLHDANSTYIGKNYPTFGHKGKGTYHFTFCDQRTFVIMHNL